MNQLWRFHVSPFSLLIVVLLAQPSAAQQATVIQQWRFDQASLDKQTLRSVDKQRLADLANSPQLDGDGSLSFSQGQFAVVRDGATDLPTSSFSVEAWVRIDATIRWGSVFGFQQDNGSYERGWSLGYNQDRFEFRVADDRHMINATAVTPMTLKQWHHVVGVCDTKRQQLRLYVDGKSQSVVSVKMDGANYPSVDDQTELVIGAYKDKDELFPMVGRLREVRLYDGVLNDDAIAAHVEWQQDLPEKALAFSVRPGVRFLSPTTAEVRWETTFDGVSALAFGLTRRPDQIVTSDTKGFSHRVVMKDLEPGKDYWYRFGNQRDGKRSFSPFYLLEGSMNYMPSVMERDDSHQPATNQIAKALPQQGGYAVTLGVDSSWPKSIATETAMNVIAVVDDPRKRNELRKDW